MEPFRQKGSSMASWSTFIFKSVSKFWMIRHIQSNHFFDNTDLKHHYFVVALRNHSSITTFGFIDGAKVDKITGNIVY